MARYQNTDWKLPDGDLTGVSFQIVHSALLMDLRDELKAMNRQLTAISDRLDCPETLSIPRTLKRIARNTAKPRKKENADGAGSHS